MTSAASIIIPPKVAFPFTTDFTTLRAIDSDIQQDGQPINVRSSDSIYVWDSASIAVDDETIYIRPDDRTALQAGRWILSNIGTFTASGGSSLVGFIAAGVGAVAQSVQSVLRRRVDVKQYGATGDGTTVDSAAINDALAACATGDTLYFPSGTYIVDSSDESGGFTTFPLPYGVDVLMDGNAWLKRKSSQATGMFFFSCTNGGNTLKVNIDGDEYPGVMFPQSSWTAPQCTGVYIRAANVIVVNSKFKNLTYGVRTEGGSYNKVLDSHFYRIRFSGVLMQATAALAASHNDIAGCSFDSTGDTAAAFHIVDASAICSYNRIRSCTAKDSQYLAAGYAFDFEGGFGPGKIYHNEITDCTVEQTAGDTWAQGGVTMNLYSEYGVIANNNVRGRTTGALTSDVGIGIPGTTGVLVEGNVVENFRGNGINAEGAAYASVKLNKIKNCGDGSAPQFSSILVSHVSGSTGCVFSGNEIDNDPRYIYRGSSGAAIYGRKFNANNIIEPVFENNIIRHPLGYGIYLFGFGGALTGRITAEGNKLTGSTDADLGSPAAWVTATAYTAGTVVTNAGVYYMVRTAHTSAAIITTDISAGRLQQMFNAPVYISYVGALSFQNNRIYEFRQGIDLTGATNVEFKNNTLENLTISSTIAIGLNLTSADKVRVEGNRFAATFTSKITTTSATNLTFRRNDGYVTENFGTSAAIATGGTIAHGLDRTPTSVSLVAQGTTTAKVAATVTATNIAVTHDSGGSTAFFWRAEA